MIDEPVVKLIFYNGIVLAWLDSGCVMVGWRFLHEYTIMLGARYMLVDAKSPLRMQCRSWCFYPSHSTQATVLGSSTKLSVGVRIFLTYRFLRT